ncbi:MAG: sugar phosphate isomerase/epimerase [Caldilinea sp. CFX5]|nr:sugar phosphate isomerase/epimerase [Caldilinea sp. CFX5]
MRLGAPLFQPYDDPLAWVAALQAKGYRAAYCPVKADADLAVIAAYRQAAQAAGIVIAEVGAWSNPLSPDPAVRAAALDKCKAGLLLAERIGARCCVNIAGSRGEKWDGPHPADLTEETFDMIVATTREIIDAVQPRQAVYALETMPWMYPDSVESYQRLLKAIDRPGCGVHFDPVNLINSPPRYFRNGALIRAAVAALGAQMRSVHVKDIQLANQLTVHLDEARPGTGGLDLHTLLRELNRLEPTLPIMLEHLPNEAEYELAAAHVRAVAQEEGILL